MRCTTATRRVSPRGWTDQGGAGRRLAPHMRGVDWVRPSRRAMPRAAMRSGACRLRKLGSRPLDVADGRSRPARGVRPVAPRGMGITHAVRDPDARIRTSPLTHQIARSGPAPCG